MRDAAMRQNQPHEPPAPPAAVPTPTANAAANAATAAPTVVAAVPRPASHSSAASEGAVPPSLPIADAIWDSNIEPQAGTLVAVASCANTRGSATTTAGAAPNASVGFASDAPPGPDVHEHVAHAAPIAGAPTVDGAVVRAAVDARFIVDERHT